MLKAPADGHTLGAATSSALAIRPALFKKLPYDVLADFTPVALYLKSPFILVVNPDLPVRSVPDLIRYVRERPGQVSFDSSAVGGAPHLAGEYLKQRFAIDMAHVPYRNSPQATADVVAGHHPADLRRSRRVAAADPGRQAARARSDVRRASSRRCPTFRRWRRRPTRPISRRCPGTCCSCVRRRRPRSWASCMTR